MKKIFVLLSFIILLSGCSANYKLEYVDGILKEEFILEVNNDSDCGDDYCSNYIKDYYNTNISINYLDSEEELAYSDDLSKYKFYNKDVFSKNNKYGLILDYSYENKNDYVNSRVVRYLFNNIKINEDRIIANNINDIFGNYQYLDKITISFKTDKIVNEVNCDEIKDDIYYWYIDKDNYRDKDINIVFKVDEEKENNMVEDGYLTWNSVKYIFLVLLVVLLVVILIIYEKVKNSNK